MVASLPLSATSEEYYDITSYYLQNALFDSNYDYDATKTGNVAQQMLPVNGWTNDYTMDYTIVGVYQVGTKKTYNGASIPAANFEGTAEGGVLALSTGWEQQLKLNQTVMLPAGKYKIVSAYYNGDASKTAGKSLLGWIPTKGTSTMSKVASFPVGEWVEDELTFMLTTTTTGKIQIGFKAASNGSGNSAKIAVDYVKLLRDTPYGDADEELRANPTGPIPTVTTDTRYVRGATMAFGRMEVMDNGSVIKEQGFCYGEDPEPTIDDNRSSATLTNNGDIFWIKDLTPATKYYMRAYAVTAGYQVAYGDVIKFYTVPKGNVSFTLRNNGDDATKSRIKAAAEKACEYYNNLTSTTRHFSIGFESGTETADCNYQAEPWMRVVPKENYQRTGTIMHEMMHGLGLQNYSTQWCQGNLRSGNGTGIWTGDRVTEALTFWENKPTELKGDNIHMWPYGINGADEDNGTDLLYLGNAIICQALGEDGLEHNETRHADPYYSLSQEDDVKYYFKNESANRGLYTSFLMPNKSGALKWVTMSSDEATQNDSTAWYITFTPENQYYQIRNAATGQYLTYSGSIKTMARTNLTANDNWHLMKGRVDVDGYRGYWMIHPESNWTPHCLQANANGNTASVAFNIANSAEPQRWLILTAEQMNTLEIQAVTEGKNAVETVIARMNSAIDVPHTEDIYGADEALKTALNDIQARKDASTSTSELSALVAEAQSAGMTFLQQVSTIDPMNPFDLTWLLQNPTVDDDIEGWTATAVTAQNYGCVEYYEKTFDFNQTVKGLPAGNYAFGAQAFQRPGPNSSAGGVAVNALIYAGSQTAQLNHITVDAQASKIGTGSEVTIDNKYVPNDMQAASAYFKKGLYQNTVNGSVATDNGSLKVGIKSTKMDSGYWVIFDNFHLYFYGGRNYLKGDANNDGKIDIVDVTSTISHILGQTPVGFALKAADVTGDGNIDIVDVTTIIDLILNQH